MNVACEPTRAPAQRALYLYAIARDHPGGDMSLPRELSSLSGLDGNAVEAVRFRDIAVFTHTCLPEPYEGHDEQVKAWVLAHNNVVEAVQHAMASVLPMSFDSIVASRDDVPADAVLVDWLTAAYEPLRARLDAVAGRSEAVVKIFVELPESPESPERGESANRAPLDEKVATGREYFARRKAQRLEQDERRAKVRERCDADARRHFERIASTVEDVRINSPRPGGNGATTNGGRGRLLMLNLSVLADDDQLAELGCYLQDVEQESDVSVVFTGSLPPYSFTGGFGMPGMFSEVKAQAPAAAGGVQGGDVVA